MLYSFRASLIADRLRAAPRRRLYATGLGVGALLVLAPAAVGPVTTARASAPQPADSRTMTASAIMPLSREEATARNAAIAVQGSVGPAAQPFASGANSGSAADRALECLATAVYYEAASEPLEAQRAVAQVVLNRVRHTAYPNSICGVVFEGSARTTGCQFTFTCDGAMHRRRPHHAGWTIATQIASQALNGYVHAPVGLATHFHADWVLPYWASSLAKVGKFGTTIFYRLRGAGGQPSAFQSRYAGGEPEIPLTAPERSAGAPELEEQTLLAGVDAPSEGGSTPADDFGLLDYKVKDAPKLAMAEENGDLSGALAAAQVRAPSGTSVSSKIRSSEPATM